MTEERRVPAGSQPATQQPKHPSRGSVSSHPPPLSASSKQNIASEAPMLSASSGNSHSLFSFSRDGLSKQHTSLSSAPYEFLPSVSFDDFHASIESASTEFKRTDPPLQTDSRTTVEPQLPREKKIMERPNGNHNSGATHRGSIPQAATRTGRSGSMMRRTSNSSRQPSISSLNSLSDAATATTVSSRSRRQSHYPPVSNNNLGGMHKPPRKSVGPGILGDFETQSHTAQRRRPSLRGADLPGRSSIDGVSTKSDSTRGFVESSRAMKAKSVQPPPRSGHGNLLGNVALTPDQSRLSTLGPRSPRMSVRGNTPSSTNSKRMSMMPSGHHASGLGARTISPTDTRRMKRMSTMPQSQSLINLITNAPPPPPVSMDNRAESRSPSMIPRKTSATPSSARTTPDLTNRKSYSSGVSVGSAASLNTVRTSTGSIQPRLPQSASTSRLPAPKHTAGHSSAPPDEGEDVPPVPAIPKAYESPKDTNPAPAETYFEKKSWLGSAGVLAAPSELTSGLTIPTFPEPVKEQRKAASRKSSFISTTRGDDESSRSQQKKQLPPLSLPPLNLGTFSAPTTSKVAQGREGGRAETPPPTFLRPNPKTPTTPLTASKSSFFSKSTYDETMELPPVRSSSSVHHSRRKSPPVPYASSPESSLDDNVPKPSLSPFLSSSLPKGGSEHAFMQRSKTGNDYATLSGPFFTDKDSSKPASSTTQQTEKPVSHSSTTAPESGPDEPPQTPSSMSSLRRKLSKSWKRGGSKSGITTEPMPEKAMQPPPPRHDSMGPPRIPVSATVSSLPTTEANGSHPPKPVGGYLDSRRRKSSSASLSSMMQAKSDGTYGKKESAAATASADVSTMPAARTSTTTLRTLKPKGSSQGMRPPESYTAELDKEDLAAEEEMRKLGSRRKDTELAARTIDALRKRASPKERVGPHEAIRIAMLNIYERGEIIDYPDVYFCGTQNAHKVVGNLQSDAPNFGYDDDRGDYSIVPGDHLSYRYEIIDILGKGSFGQVVRCIDHKSGVLVAVKIIRNKKRFHQQALVEVNILQKLREWDPKNKYSMVNFTQSFYFRGHLCISTELLDMNLFELIKAHSFRGFSLRIVRRFTKQMLASLIVLKQHKVIHCDLKPENILLRHPLHAELKVIDFGSSCFEHEKVYTYIQSRFYRSPEVILGMTYGLPIDMWSLGCILAELYTGVPIFPGENEQEQLACIMEVFGPPEKHLIEKSTRKKLFFDSMGKPRLTVSTKGRRRRPSSKTLQSVLKCDDEAFLDFIARCLRWDPDRRLKPDDAIRHEFITGIKRPKTAVRDSSPAKRTISAPRLLPEPPSAAPNVKPTSGANLRSGVSPHKTAPGATRRVSGVTAPTTASVAKRASAGTGAVAAASATSASASGLPRAAGRTASGRQADLAAAGASAAMSRRV